MYSHYSEYIGHDALPCAHTRTHIHSVVMHPWATKDIFTFQIGPNSLSFSSYTIHSATEHIFSVYVYEVGGTGRLQSAQYSMPRPTQSQYAAT